MSSHAIGTPDMPRGLRIARNMDIGLLVAALPVFLLYASPKLPPWPFHLLIAVLFLAPAIPALKLGEPPTETWCLLGLWALSGWSWIRRDMSGGKVSTCRFQAS